MWLCTLLFFAPSFSPADQSQTIELSYDNGICLSVNVTAPEIADVHTVRRLFSEAKSFKIEPPSTSKAGWLSLKTPSYSRPGDNAQYFGQCNFVEGVEGFLRQSDDNFGGCRPTSGKAYHSNPGTKDNIIVRCLELQETNCSISLIEAVDSIDIGVFFFFTDQPPSSWMAISEDLRSFVAKNIFHNPDCR